MHHQVTLCIPCIYLFVFVFFFSFASLRRQQHGQRGLRLEMGLVAVEVERQWRGGLQDYDWGCCREGCGGLRWKDNELDVWL